jgi:hypothetical protein
LGSDSLALKCKVEPGNSKGGEFKKAAMLQMAESVIAAMATVTSLAVGFFAPNGIARLIRMRIRAAFMIVLFCIISYGYKENNQNREKRQSEVNVIQSVHELPFEPNNHLLV